jgi:excisionase family DNA binding protein
MTIAVPDLTVLPPAEPLDELLELLRRMGSGRPAELVGPDGTRLPLPTPVYEVLSEVVQAMARGQAVTIAPHNQRLTTQEAADLLGISRPTLVKMLDDGRIPFEQPGRHRRVLLRDVLAFQDNRRAEREAALNELIEASEEADGYQRTAHPKPTGDRR